MSTTAKKAGTVKLPDLYKMTSSGKIQVWSICYGNDYATNVAFYMVNHGQLHGKIQETRTDVPVGKNIGKANETSPLEQAESEAVAIWKKKQDRNGYSKKVPTKADKQFRPMLAKSYNAPGNDLNKLKDGKHINYPCYYQPKLDGIRCNVSFNSKPPITETLLLSRQGKKFESLDHLRKDVVSVLPGGLIVILDGELYVHGEEFQELVSAIKRDKPSDKSADVEYHIYDAYFPLNPEWCFEKRQQEIERLFPPSKIKGTKIKLVKSAEITKDKVEDKLREYCSKGYEGIMLRNKAGKYKVDGRSADLQKVKLFQDREYKIVGAVENKGKLSGTATFICETEDGTQFKCIPEGSQELRSKYWSNRDEYIGKLLTVRYFSMTTSENPVPRFPIGVSIRDYE